MDNYKGVIRFGIVYAIILTVGFFWLLSNYQQKNSTLGTREKENRELKESLKRQRVQRHKQDSIHAAFIEELKKRYESKVKTRIVYERRYEAIRIDTTIPTDSSWSYITRVLSRD